MENENKDNEDVIVEEEENIDEQENKDESNNKDESEDTVTLSKAEFTKLKRQSIAYKANKEQPKKENINNQAEDNTDSIIKTVSALRSIEDSEIEILEAEAKNLGLPLIKYIQSESGKTYLKNIRADKKSKDADISPSTKSPVYKKFTQEDLSKMSSKELEKILPKA